MEPPADRGSEMVIQQTGDSTFNMQRGAHDMTLTKEGEEARAWDDVAYETQPVGAA